MNWQLAVEKNREALKRILVMLVGLVGMTGGMTESDAVARPSTLPRHLHRFVLSLLRPAEAATRRLIIVAARGMTVELAPLRPRRRKTKPEPRTILVLDRVNGSIVSVPVLLPEPVRDPAPRRLTPSIPSLPLFDPPQRFELRRRYRRSNAMPRVSRFDDRREAGRAAPIPSLSSDDPVDAARVHRRLQAIGRALDYLPGQATRFARWQARVDARLAQYRETREPAAENESQPTSPPVGRRFQRREPLRRGRPPGWRRKPKHDVHEILNELHGLAIWARQRSDTS